MPLHMFIMDVLSVQGMPKKGCKHMCFQKGSIAKGAQGAVIGPLLSACWQTWVCIHIEAFSFFGKAATIAFPAYWGHIQKGTQTGSLPGWKRKHNIPSRKFILLPPFSCDRSNTKETSKQVTFIENTDQHPTTKTAGESYRRGNMHTKSLQLVIKPTQDTSPI